MSKKVWLEVENYYGEPYVIEEDGKHYICLKSWNGINKKEISKRFYDECVKEFGFTD